MFHAEAKTFAILKELESGKSNLLEPLCSPLERIKELSFILPLARSDLHQFLNNPISLSYRNSIWGQIGPLATGLSTLHRANIAHCNLCPQNILVFDGEPGQVVLKIADFGHSISTQSTSFFNRKSNGTYSAPECWSGSIRSLEPIDIWALGCVITEMITFVWYGPEGMAALETIWKGPLISLGGSLQADTYHDGTKMRAKVHTWLTDLRHYPTCTKVVDCVQAMLGQDPNCRSTAEIAAQDLNDLKGFVFARDYGGRNSGFGLSMSRLYVSCKWDISCSLTFETQFCLCINIDDSSFLCCSYNQTSLN
jgi:serine/threonine protein kinase